MTEKHIYTSNELPDHALDEFEKIRNAFLALIAELALSHSARAVNAGFSRAHLDLIQMTALPGNLKKVLMNTAEYYIQAAEALGEA